MSDMIEMFQALKEHRKDEKRTYALGAGDALAKLSAMAGVVLVPMKGAGHYRVNNRWDYWPATGRWITLSTQRGGRGVTSLIAAIVRATP